MSGWRGALGAALVLIALQTLVQPASAQRVGGLVGWSVGLVHRFMDPTVPAIPDHSKPHASFDFFDSLRDAITGAAGAVAGPIGGAVGAVGGVVSGGVLGGGGRISDRVSGN